MSRNPAAARFNIAACAGCGLSAGAIAARLWQWTATSAPNGTTARRSQLARLCASSPVTLSPSKTAHASEQEPLDVLARRHAWCDAQPDFDPRHLIVG